MCILYMCLFSPLFFLLSIVCNFHCFAPCCFYLTFILKIIPYQYREIFHRVDYILLHCFDFPNLFHSLLIDHLRSFQILNITDNAAMNNLVPMSYCIYRMYLWDRFLEVGLLDQREHASAVLLEVAKFFSIGELFCIFTIDI